MSYSLIINWTAASPVPANGYRVRYWPTSNPSAVTTVTPNVSGTTHTITGLSATSYAGTVEAHCGGSNYSTAQSFTANYDFYYYTLSKYDCSNSCAQVGTTGQFVGRSTTALSTTSGTHYKVGNFTYVVNTLVTPDPSAFDVDLNTATATGSTCSAACGSPSNGTISILNNGGSGAVISDFQPTWFFIDNGVIPVQNLGSATGGHGGFTGNFGVTVTGATGGCLSLTVNGAVIQTFGISASGIYTFLSVTIPSNASVIISLDQGACQ
jgi:hypothetical protein